MDVFSALSIFLENIEQSKEYNTDEMAVRAFKRTIAWSKLAKIDPKAKVRNKPNCVFDNTNSKVKDNKDHFPLGDADQARNALAQCKKYTKVPPWYNGSLEELQKAVARKVKKEYPSIQISDKKKD